jgi:hypothetical protein
MTAPMRVQNALGPSRSHIDEVGREFLLSLGFAIRFSVAANRARAQTGKPNSVSLACKPAANVPRRMSD